MAFVWQATVSDHTHLGGAMRLEYTTIIGTHLFSSKEKAWVWVRQDFKKRVPSGKICGNRIPKMPRDFTDCGEMGYEVKKMGLDIGCVAKLRKKPKVVGIKRFRTVRDFIRDTGDKEFVREVEAAIKKRK